MNAELKKYLEQYISVPDIIQNDKDAIDLLATEINKLIEKDFERLIQLLYRTDVNENKLREILKENPQADAGKIIASMVIERQLERIKSKKEFKPPPVDNDEELW